MFAVVKIGSSQYLVSPGQELLIDYQGVTQTKLTFDRVLLTEDEGEVVIGKPFVDGIVVTADILDHPLGDKIRIGKFKAKSRYRKVRGFRPHYTRIKITGITSGNSSKSADSETPVKKTPVTRAKRTK